MTDILPRKLKELAAACNFSLYVVGGTCREYITGAIPEKRDFDICAPASPEEVAAVAAELGFRQCAVYKNTGTVKLKAEGDDYEFTSFRSDKYVRGVHTPVRIYFTDDINLDALRRDFTCNAIYYDIKAQEFVDPLGGITDVKDAKVRTVAPSEKVFGEDGLRLMRLARLCGETGFTPDSECLEGAKQNCALIKDISAERIYAELNNILLADKKYGVKYGQYEGLDLLRSTGVLKQILPELSLGDGMSQRRDFHMYDVLEHSFRCVKYAPEDIRLAALLHDVGKPYCKITTGVYHDHDKEGERIAREICTRLKAPKKVTEEVARLTALHMYDVSGDARESKIRRMVVRNSDIFTKLLELKQADFTACRDDFSVAPAVTKWMGIYNEMMKEGVPLSVKELNVRGDELIAAGIAPQRAGKVLESLLYECAIFPRLNEREKLISKARRMENI